MASSAFMSKRFMQVEEQPASQETAALVPMPKSDAAENSPGHAPKVCQYQSHPSLTLVCTP